MRPRGPRGENLETSVFTWKFASNLVLADCGLARGGGPMVGNGSDSHPSRICAANGLREAVAPANEGTAEVLKPPIRTRLEQNPFARGSVRIDHPMSPILSKIDGYQIAIFYSASISGESRRQFWDGQPFAHPPESCSPSPCPLSQRQPGAPAMRRWRTSRLRSRVRPPNARCLLPQVIQSGILLRRNRARKDGEKSKRQVIMQADSYPVRIPVWNFQRTREGRR
jgi:hypothetical protein